MTPCQRSNTTPPMLILTLRRFTVEACHSLIKKALPPSQAGNGELLEQIYNETEGNPFLLNEYIAMLQRGESLDHPSPAIQSFLRTQLLGLSQEALELAEVLSCFYDARRSPLRLRFWEKTHRICWFPWSSWKIGESS